MVDEDILTSLKNAIEREEDLEDASQTLINAGYSAKDVGEAKDFLQKGVLLSEVEKAEENADFEQAEIKIESKPSFFSKLKGIFSKKKKEVKKEENLNETPEEAELREDIKKMPSIKPPHPDSLPSENNTSLMIAIAILAILIALLALAIVFRDSIINWF